MIHHLDRNESSCFTSEGGITCFDFCEKLNCLVTGCIDNSVKVWNPSEKTSCNEILTGHFNSVTHALVAEKHDCIISADRDKTVRVWSLLRSECLQVIKFKEADFAGKQIFATLYLDKEYDKLIITTNRIAVLNARSADLRKAAHPDSELIIYTAYNSVFDCFITVGNKASIAIWNAQSFLLVHEFAEAHVAFTRIGIPQVVDVSVAALDPTERRLVTADRNGIVKVWNFHLGICLKEFQAKFSVMALSVLGYEIFAAGSSGLINMFYDDGESRTGDIVWRTLHEQAIVSIDTYTRDLLASASCDGEIIVWLWKNEDAKLRMRDCIADGTESSEVSNDYPAKTLVDKRKYSGISEILFLKTREMDASVGNLVSCGIDGRIRFWNVICTIKVNKWKLLSKFRAVFRKCDGVLCMETDKENKFLLTGDTMGYLRIYNLEDYYSSYGSVPANAKLPEPHHYEKYPFLKLQHLIQTNHSQHSKISSDGGAEVGFAPLLLNCFRAHMGPLLKVGFSNEKELVITAARQGSVRLWTLSGIYLGFLGSDDAYPSSRMKIKPPDIQASASTTTLHVLNGGKKPYWESAIEALKRCRLGHSSQQSTEKPFAWIEKKKLQSKEFSEEFTLHHELEKRLPRYPGKSTPKLRLHDLRRDDIARI
ncbi:WD repeat-containing protein on Y chromosome-like [Argiope bruennichi]|uniref:WD repeat-containing protein on Y chromosome-like n=1 Tax=Argiope bruennichi TaxID=94029 RepID=UPI002493E95F|nr:WD repeat-containing protein on Y chromosome-like [Argiope bruennichi]